VPMTGIPGSPPDLRDPPGGCPFHPRCGYAMDRCRTDLPPLRPLAGAGPRVAACWLHDGPAPPPAELARPEPKPGPGPRPDPGPAAGADSPTAGADSPTSGTGGTAADTGTDPGAGMAADTKEGAA
jgi:hypothetical protein